jgi:hypothetical protein
VVRAPPLNWIAAEWGNCRMGIVGAKGRWTAIAAVAALVLCAALQIGDAVGLARKDEAPRNFDPFGYLRQAQLFQTYGVIGGLDTSFRGSVASYLKETAEKIDPDPSHWAYSIAPPAHHLEPRTGRIVDQYPPGTGFFLHFYRQGVQMRSSLFAALTLIFVSAALCLYFSNSLLRVFAVVLLAVPLADNVFRETFSYSSHLSQLFAAAIGLLGTLFFFRAGRERIVIAAIVALLIGLSASIRISDLLFFVGYAPIAWALLRSSDRSLGIPLVVLAALAGLAPLAIANHINMGGIFQIGYPEHDEAVGFEPAFVWENLKAYFGITRHYQAIDWIALFGLGAAAGLGRYRRRPLVALLPAFLNLASGIGFFAVHSINGPWYFTSHAVVVLSAAAAYVWFCARVHEAEPELLLHRAPVLVVACITVLVSIFFAQRIRPSFDPHMLAEKFKDTDIVYACEISGLFVQSGVYSPCLLNGDFEFAQRLVRRVSNDGRRQFVAIDSPAGRELLERVCVGAEKEFASVAGFPVFMIPPGLQNESGAPCGSRPNEHAGLSGTGAIQ